MKKSIKAIIAISALFIGFNAAASSTQYDCQYPLFHAFTAKGNKEVMLCVSGDKVTYTFGKRDVEKPELDIAVPKSRVHVYNFRYGDEGTVANGAYTYSVSAMTDENGKPINQLTVYKGEKVLTTIPFSDVIMNNLNSDLDYYGIEVE